MPGYTDEEIQSVVESLVISTIRRPYDTLGVRRTDVSFSDVQEAVAGVFILYPNAPFYVLYLGTQRLQDLIDNEVLLIESLIDAIEATDRKVLPVEDVSTLFNAQAALQELGSAAARRGGTFQDITKAPAYQRFSDNVNRFLAGPGLNIKSGGQIVQTPQQARTVIPGLVAQLNDAHKNLVARVTGIANGIDDYNKVNLPSVVSSSILSNSAKLVGDDADALEALSPTDRLTLIRKTVLDVLATRSVVTTFGSFSGPSDYYTLEGLGVPFSDALREASPAVATGDIGGAAAIIAGVSDRLDLTMDGGTPFSIFLNPSLLAFLEGLADDSTFVIGDGTTPLTPGAATPNNNKLKVRVDGVTYEATLTSSGASMAAVMTGTGDTTTGGWYGGGGSLNGTTLIIDVDGVFSYTVTFAAPANVAALLSQINAITNVAGAQHRVVATNVADRLVLTTINTGAPARISMRNGTSNAVLGFTDGQLAVGAFATRTADQVATDINAVLPAGVIAEGYYSPLRFAGTFDIPVGVNQTWTATGGMTDLVALGVVAGMTVNVLSGPNAGIYLITNVTTTTIDVVGTTVLELGASVEIGSANRKVRIRCNDPVTQLPLETELYIYGDTTASLNGLRTLGFFDGIVSYCRRTTPDLVATDINSKTDQVTAAAVTSNSLENQPARANPADPNLITLARASATGSQSFAGPILTFTVTSLAEGQVQVGDALVLRSGTEPGQYYVIDTINGSAAVGLKDLAVGDVIVATGTLSGTPTTAVEIEVGPNLSLSRYDVLTVVAGPNAGQYFVDSQGDTPLDVLLQRILFVTQEGLDPLEMVVSVGELLLSLKSKNKNTQSQVLVDGSGAQLFFSTTPTTAYGTTPWLQLPSLPRGLQPGDVLELYDTVYNIPSSSHVVQTVGDPRIIEVEPEVPSNISWQFTPQPVPFARLRVGTMNDFAAVKERMNAWLAESVNQPLFFTNFNRLINPLLANENPTVVQVGDALNTLRSLYAFLLAAQAALLNQPEAQALDSIIGSFTVQQVAAVDALLQSFLEKGSDRAVDLLLAGEFSTFFGLSQDGSSYAGAFQEAVRAVALNDLPVRKYNRSEAQTSRLLSQSQSPDFEYTGASVNENLGGPEVDPPGNFGEPADFGRE